MVYTKKEPRRMTGSLVLPAKCKNSCFMRNSFQYLTDTYTLLSFGSEHINFSQEGMVGTSYLRFQCRHFQIPVGSG